jgi:hypothetical protein
MREEGRGVWRQYCNEGRLLRRQLRETMGGRGPMGLLSDSV